MDEMAEGSVHLSYRLVAISTPSAFPRHVHVDERSVPQIVSLMQEYVADLGQECLSAVTLLSRLTVHQRNAQNQPGEGQRHVIAGSFGDPLRILDLVYDRIDGLQHAIGYSGEVTPRDYRSVGQGVGAAGHGQAVAQVVAPVGTTQAITGRSP